LRTKVRPFPSAAAYVLPRTVWDDSSRFYIALELAESYNADIVFLTGDRRFDGAAHYAAQIFVTLAALALLVNFCRAALVRTSSTIDGVQGYSRFVVEQSVAFMHGDIMNLNKPKPPENEKPQPAANIHVTEGAKEPKRPR
jgi:hypothetical protein